MNNEINDVITLYRAGIVSPVVNHESSLFQKYTEICDNMKPASRQGRIGATFASVNVKSHLNWASPKKENFEIKIFPENVYMYKITQWERYDSLCDDITDHDFLEEYARYYWDTGVSLTDYFNNSEMFGKSAIDYEVLVPFENILEIRKIPHKEMESEFLKIYPHVDFSHLFNH